MERRNEIANALANDIIQEGKGAHMQNLISEAAPENKAEKYDKAQVKAAQLRFLDESSKLDKVKERNERLISNDTGIHEEFKDKKRIKAVVEMGGEIIESRMKYDIGIINNELAIELLKFGEHTFSQKVEFKRDNKRIKSLKKALKKAKKLEENATKRYYTTLYKEAEKPTILKNAERQERLKLVISRIQGLLRERESLDRRLEGLYDSAESRSGGKVRAKAEKKRYKVAKRIHKNLKSSYNHYSKANIPDSLKIKICYLYNTKITSKSTIAYSAYLLKKLKPKGDAKVELKKNIKTAEKSLALLEAKLKKVTRKARALAQHKKPSKKLFRGFLIIALLAVIAAGAYFVLGM